MKFTMVIPSYWGRESKIGYQEGDAIYDHPTALNADGTLHRAIQSTNVLKDKDFELVIIAVATSRDIEQEVERKVAEIIKSANPEVEVMLFGNSHLRQIHDLLRVHCDKNAEEYISLLQLRGYSNVRNLCLFIPHILDSDVAVLIDDDEVFEDPEFMSKAREFIGREIEGIEINAVAGYYINPDGDYHVKKPFRPWMKYWDQYERMNEAFDNIIGTEPRLKETPFAFGGNMIIHRNLFTTVPFDANVRRGEDIDFLMNARIFGFSFFLDNQLSIKHLPPPKMHPTWMQLREDIYRFVYERAKIDTQTEMEGMQKIQADNFDPYPGCFLKADLEEKIELACKLLSEEYLAKGDRKGSKEVLNNISIAKTDAVPKLDPFQNLCELQRRWHELMRFTSREDIRSQMRDIICKERREIFKN